MRDKIAEIIAKFNADCEAKGHHWASNPLCERTEYCQGCGKTRPAFGIEGDG
jgi:hypothetical protein